MKTYVGRFAVKFEKFVEVKLRGLENLGFANVHILQWVDASASLLDFAADSLRQEFLDELLQVACCSFASHDLEHLLPDLADLTGLGVGGLADL